MKACYIGDSFNSIIRLLGTLAVEESQFWLQQFGGKYVLTVSGKLKYFLREINTLKHCMTHRSTSRSKRS